MDAQVTVADLGRRDLGEIGARFEAHAGRPADLATFERWIDGWPSAGARRDGALVGYLVTQRVAPDSVEVTSLLVAPGSRNDGIGARLVTHVEQECRRRAIAGLVAVSSTDYDVAAERRSPRSFYERLGYRVVLETPSTLLFGRTLDDGAGG